MGRGRSKRATHAVILWNPGAAPALAQEQVPGTSGCAAVVLLVQVCVWPWISRRCARSDLLRIPSGAGVSCKVENLRTAAGNTRRNHTAIGAEPGMSGLAENTVVAWRGPGGEYCSLAPFSPSRPYPEYALGDSPSESNPAYEGVRGCFHTAGLDLATFDPPDWNPLKELIHPGETVLLSPNMVHQPH